MTVINVLITPEAATIVTDTLARAPGHPDFHTSKVMPLPHMRLALATRGRMDALIKVVGAICVGAFDFDSARAFMVGAYSQLGLDEVEVVVAGWGKDGPAAFIVSAANTGGAVTDIPYVLVTPTVPVDVFEQFAEDPVAGMPALMKQQAMSPDVGGFMNICQVGETVIESYVAERLG